MGVTTVSRSLSQLATEANREHALCDSAYSTAVRHADAAGRLLTEAREQLRHGEWLPWLEEHFSGSIRTAQGYMRLAASTQDLAHLGIEQALRAIAAPRPEPAPAASDVEREHVDAEPDPFEALTGHQGVAAGGESFRDALKRERERRFPRSPDERSRWRSIATRTESATAALERARPAEMSERARAEEIAAAGRELREAAALCEELAGALRAA